MIPALPSKFPQMLLSLGIALLFLGYLTVRMPYDSLNNLADRQSDLTKASNLDENAYKQDSINLIARQTELIKMNTILAQKSPDSIKLLIENNHKIAEREIELHEFYQKHRPQYHALDVQGYINEKLDGVVNYTCSIIWLGIIFGLAGFGLSICGLVRCCRDYKKEISQK